MLAEVIRIARDIHRANNLTRADWEFRKRDIGGAWSDGTWTDRLRVIALGPLSMGEHALNRGQQAATLALLKPALALGLASIKNTPEAAPFGDELANATANALIRNLKPQRDGSEISDLCYRHRDYCGMGLSCTRLNEAVSFTYSSIEDGYPSCALQTFTSIDEFVDWLARQSDLSLSGLVGAAPYLDWDNMGNQRLSHDRLRQYSLTR